MSQLAWYWFVTWFNWFCRFMVGKEIWVEHVFLPPSFVSLYFSCADWYRHTAGWRVIQKPHMKLFIPAVLCDEHAQTFHVWWMKDLFEWGTLSDVDCFVSPAPFDCEWTVTVLQSRWTSLCRRGGAGRGLLLHAFKSLKWKHCITFLLVFSHSLSDGCVTRWECSLWRMAVQHAF